MNSITLNKAVKIYDCAAACSACWYPLKHPLFQSFCKLLQQFDRRASAVEGEDYWSSLLRVLKRLRFSFSTTPISFDRTEMYPVGFFETVNWYKQRYIHVYPTYEVILEPLLDTLNQMVQLKQNPPMDKIEALTNPQEKVAILLKDSRIISLIEAELCSRQRLGNIKLVTSNYLKGMDCYDRLILVGPSYLFPPSILNSPRAKEVDILHYEWIRDRWENDSFFLGSDGMNLKIKIRKATKEVENTTDKAPVQENQWCLEVGELLQSIDWVKVREVFSSEVSESYTEGVQAFPILLDGGQVAFLESKEEERVWTIDLDDESSSKVKRIPTLEIRQGMFLILRTAGGGDYMITLAEQMLGDKLDQIKNAQLTWKSLLRKAVESKGIHKIISELLSLGSVIANEPNIRNWMSERNISPKNPADFKAIMNLIKLPYKTEEYWQIARTLETAHRIAGLRIGKMLLKLIVSASLDELERVGRMDFELTGLDGGSLTAFRVEEISHETYLVPTARIGRLLERDDCLWLE
ncbi:hypothetical protein ACOBQJ_12945 [Pelotomaculum propionicicum]|uniref:DISARM anti-phage system protein DrmE domain-containing protein n=1 Tax=Pelotomaculum propionicicum TaxID=258475 RepID=UPI003B7DB38D